MNKKRAKELRAVIEQAMSKEEDSVAVEYPNLLPAWCTDTWYATDRKIVHNNVVYKVIQDHMSMFGLEPDITPDLFMRLSAIDPEEIPEWGQPDSGNPYMIDFKVRHNDCIWISTLDYNAWEPGVYGWDPYTED